MEGGIILLFVYIIMNIFKGRPEIERKRQRGRETETESRRERERERERERLNISYLDFFAMCDVIFLKIRSKRKKARKRERTRWRGGIEPKLMDGLTMFPLQS